MLAHSLCCTQRECGVSLAQSDKALVVLYQVVVFVLQIPVDCVVLVGHIVCVLLAQLRAEHLLTAEEEGDTL